MIEKIYIKNFKAFDKEDIIVKKNNIIIGENDSGKSTILQALDIFFNQDKIDKSYIRNLSEPVEIGILYNKIFYKKIYSPASFKLTSVPENISDLDMIKYIYIPVGSYDPKKVMGQLATAKVFNNTSSEIIEKIKSILDYSINEVINSIDKDLLVVDKSKTELSGKNAFKYEKSIDFSIECNGIPIESRGSGYQKSLMYALLVGNNYENVILGIDEIENSFSLNNAQKMINELQLKMGQTLFTTHSKKVMESVGNTNINIIPLYFNADSSLYELLDALDSTDTKKYIIVEGKYDLPWYKKAILILGKSDEYIVLPGGGCSDAEVLKKELEKLGKKCICITDGDNGINTSITKDCIELYTPVEILNKLFEVDLLKIPETKEEFFSEPIVNANRNSDSVKTLLSLEVDNFLKNDNDFVEEIKKILESIH